jgi:hypothetical protein
MKTGGMFALLQLYPPEASSDDNPYPLDIIALDTSKVRLERYLASYRGRYREACAESDRWDQDHSSEEWSDEYSPVSQMIAEAHSVYGSLIPGTTFKIVRCLGRVRDA